MKRLMLLAALPFLAHAASAQASFTQELGSPLPVDTDPYDVVAADFNKDGRPDLAVANGTASTISILLRKPGGGFAQEGSSIPAGSGTSVLAVADFNSDTRPDIASGFVPLASNINFGSGFNTITLPTFIDLGTSYFFRIINGGSGNSGGQISGVSINQVTPQVTALPLPASLPLFAAGLGVLGLLGQRRKRKATATA